MNWGERIYTYLTNLALVVFIWLMAELIGWKSFMLIQVPVLYIASVSGLWLFYVQHQFEHVVWTNSGEWDYKTLALKGSSYYKLPKVLQWFTGNIGFHHIHHLSPRIPNYNLERCHRENPDFQETSLITLLSSLRTLRLRLWNQQLQKMVAFKDL
jgi:omega-6 fatty acid desaturase (delta-12 desaturase)